jgi:hypothetical protein
MQMSVKALCLMIALCAVTGETRQATNYLGELTAGLCQRSEQVIYSSVGAGKA